MDIPKNVLSYSSDVTDLFDMLSEEDDLSDLDESSLRTLYGIPSSNYEDPFCQFDVEEALKDLTAVPSYNCTLYRAPSVLETHCTVGNIQVNDCLFENIAITDNVPFFLSNGNNSTLPYGNLLPEIPPIQQNCESAKEHATKNLNSRKFNGRQRKSVKKRANRCYHFWDFLQDILNRKIFPSSHCIAYVDEEGTGNEFRIRDTKEMACLWGKCKNSKTMTYEKISRVIRYYLQLDILKRVPGKRMHFKFGEGNKIWSRV